MRRRGWIVNITSFAAELPPGPPFPTNLVALEGSGYGVSKAALNRLTVSVAAELFADGVAVNALAPQSAIATPHLVAQGQLDADHFEPLETMAEAVLALSTGDPAVLTGRVARSLELLVELDRPVRTLDGSRPARGLAAGAAASGDPSSVGAAGAAGLARPLLIPFRYCGTDSSAGRSTARMLGAPPLRPRLSAYIARSARWSRSIAVSPATDSATTHRDGEAVGGGARAAHRSATGVEQRRCGRSRR